MFVCLCACSCVRFFVFVCVYVPVFVCVCLCVRVPELTPCFCVAALLLVQSGLEDSRENTVPVRVTLYSPTMSVGATRPDIDLFRILDSYNFNAFTLHLSRQLSGVYSIDHVPSAQITVLLHHGK